MLGNYVGLKFSSVNRKTVLGDLIHRQILLRKTLLEFEPFVITVTLQQSVRHKVMRTFLKSTAALRPKGSVAEAVVVAACAPGWPAVSPTTASHLLSAPPCPQLKVQRHSTRKLILDVKSSLKHYLCVYFCFLNDFLMYSKNFKYLLIP